MSRLPFLQLGGRARYFFLERRNVGPETVKLRFNVNAPYEHIKASVYFLRYLQSGTQQICHSCGSQGCFACYVRHERSARQSAV
jgi:hypothetical protein